MKIAAHLADKPFGGIQLDVSPRAHELDVTDRVALANSLEFAGIPAPEIEIVDVHRHAAEKFHAMIRDFGDRENTRVRDLVDLVILIEHDLLTPATVAAAARKVWAERDGIEPPDAIPRLPGSWPSRYERLAADHDLETQSFAAAVASVARLWAAMFPTEET
jgi:nucleotidyltransferase AbiEii toxin of type IV toxin-antitoxin system